VGGGGEKKKKKKTGERKENIDPPSSFTPSKTLGGGGPEDFSYVRMGGREGVDERKRALDFLPLRSRRLRRPCRSGWRTRGRGGSLLSWRGGRGVESRGGRGGEEVVLVILCLEVATGGEKRSLHSERGKEMVRRCSVLAPRGVREMKSR